MFQVTAWRKIRNRIPNKADKDLLRQVVKLVHKYNVNFKQRINQLQNDGSEVRVDTNTTLKSTNSRTKLWHFIFELEEEMMTNQGVEGRRRKMMRTMRLLIQTSPFKRGR
jgi:uncharacterized lipoprotein